jgi:pSer/pThr/pTyr-binding forkhead associated (FHA) protein
MKLSLVVQTSGKTEGKAIPIPSAQFLIGRDPQCNLRPASAMISKRHCAVLVKNNQVFLRDFDSTNGTILNDQPVKGEVPLKDGDILKVGPLCFKVSIEGVTAPVKPTPPPQTKRADIMDDDAAAMLLDLDDENGVTVTPNTAETEDAVPGGTTIMEMPALSAALEQIQKTSESETKPGETKPGETKPAEVKKKPAGLAQDAAKAILDKMRQGRRK